MVERRRYVVDFPTLWVFPAWVEQHCIIPDGFRKGAPFRHYDWQLFCTLNHYRVKPGVEAFDEHGYPVRAAAFHNRRSQVIAPQKVGKGPWTATVASGEGVGPALLAGWAGRDDGYVCAEHGCGCGWESPYESGEPMGMPWSTPLIQLLATSEDQVDNVYRPLQAMARNGPLADLMLVREGFIRLPNDGRIDVVTSSAMSRLGNPVTAYFQDEPQLYTATNKMIKVAETQRRGAAGMGGRGVETTNCFDPADMSTAQRTFESRAKDIFRFYEPPPSGLKYSVKAERRRIHAFNYAGSPHVNIDVIEGEAAELMEKDPGQAERFFGNRVVAGLGTWLERDKWKQRAAPKVVVRGTQIVLGMDGSDVDDWTAIRAETQDGYQFTPTYGPDRLPTIWNPADHGGQVPRLEVAAAVDELFGFFDVIRMYGDPPYWESELDAWAAKYGEKRVLRWETYRPVQMHAAAERLLTDVGKRDSGFCHDGCSITETHVGNARKAARLNNRYVLTKASPGQKIDACVTSIITHEAAGDVTAAGLWKKRYYAYTA